MKYPPEVLDDEEDDGTMPDNVNQLASAVVGHRIVSASKGRTSENAWGATEEVLRITLDNGRTVAMVPQGDCCAYTELESFLLHADQIEHIISGVGTTDGYTTWHIFADFGDVMEMKVGWSAGNTGYYVYGFDIQVIEPETVAPRFKGKPSLFPSCPHGRARRLLRALGFAS
jgi:hypothetical protein